MGPLDRRPNALDPVRVDIARTYSPFLRATVLVVDAIPDGGARPGREGLDRLRVVVLEDLHRDGAGLDREVSPAVLATVEHLGMARLVRVEAAAARAVALAVRPDQALEPCARLVLGREPLGEFQEREFLPCVHRSCPCAGTTTSRG